MRHAFGRRVRAMRSRKGIVDENIPQARQLGDELRVIAFFAFVKTGIFKTEHVAGRIAATAADAFPPIQSSTKATHTADDFGNGRPP